MKKHWNKYLFRILFVSTIQIFIKIGDHSFEGVIDLSARSIFFFIAFLIYWLVVWELATFLIKRAERFFSRNYSSGKTLAIVSTFALLYIIAISFLFDISYRTWDRLIFNKIDTWIDVPFPHPDMVYPLIIICLLLFVADQFSHFLVLVSRAELASEKLKQENILANYNALKNQVDPHFFFNSLSVLSSMVHSDPDLASKYIYNLSKLYRYILEGKKNSLVPLSQELEFLDSYIFLMKIRHDDSLIFNLDVSESAKKNVLVLPNSLQLLVENAIKHNTFKKEEPLLIDIYEETGFICVRNNLRIRNLMAPTTKVGLENIRNRYSLHGNANILIEENTDNFTVKLPKIEIRTK